MSLIKTCNCEDFPCCGHGEEYNPQADAERFEEQAEMGWPGDGSGLDDLADHNANEADDYAHEGDETPFGEELDGGCGDD